MFAVHHLSAPARRPTEADRYRRLEQVAAITISDHVRRRGRRALLVRLRRRSPRRRSLDSTPRLRSV